MMPMRETVWLVNLFFGLGPSPTGVLLESLALALAQKGCRVEVITGQLGYNQARDLAVRRFCGKVHLLPVGWNAEGFFGRLLSWLLFYTGVILFALFQPLPSKVVVMTTPPFLHFIFVVFRAIKRSKTELILWSQDTYPEILAPVGLLHPSRPPYRLLIAIQKWATARVDKIVVLDQATGDIVRGHGGQRIDIVPNWEITADFESTPLPPDLAEMLRAIKRDYQFLVLYTGNYGWGHDLSVVFQFLETHPDKRDFFFLFVGGGEKWKQLLTIKKEHPNWPLEVRPYLAKSAMSTLLAHADLGLVCLEDRCVGLMSPSKIHGYLLHGVPLLYVGPSGSNVAEAIDEFQCGFQVGQRDSASLERVLNGIQSEPSVLQAKAANAKVAATTRYVDTVATEAMIRLIFDNAVDGKATH